MATDWDMTWPGPPLDDKTLWLAERSDPAAARDALFTLRPDMASLAACELINAMSRQWAGEVAEMLKPDPWHVAGLIAGHAHLIYRQPWRVFRNRRLHRQIRQLEALQP